MTYGISTGESRPHEDKLLANTIMKIEGTDHSHTFISWKDQFGFRWVAEARGSGIQIVSNVEFKMNNHITNIHRYYSDEEGSYKAAIQYIWEKSLSEYGKKQLLGLGWMRLVNGLYRSLGSEERIVNPFRDGEFSQVCCEFSIRTVCTMLGIEIPLQVDNWGLKEVHLFNMKNGEQVPQKDVDRINQNGRQQLAAYRARLKKK